MIPKTERLSADVLILGGGLAGCMGAVAAIKKGCTVILADKAWVGSSGRHRHRRQKCRRYPLLRP